MKKRAGSRVNRVGRIRRKSRRWWREPSTRSRSTALGGSDCLGTNKEGIGRGREKVRYCGRGLLENPDVSRKNDPRTWRRSACSTNHPEAVTERQMSRSMSKRIWKARTDAGLLRWVWTRGCREATHHRAVQTRWFQKKVEVGVGGD